MKHIPNLLTLANLFCGCLSIVAIFSDRFVAAGFLIFLAAIFDFLDGFAARLLKAYSEIGKQLDSLADIVSFGAAPSMIAFRFMYQQPDLLFEQLPYIAFIMALFSALRLAKFNIDNMQTLNFVGMPTPANAIFWASIPLVFMDLQKKFPLELVKTIFNPNIIALLCIVFAFLLVCKIPMFSMKFKDVTLKNNWPRFMLIWLILGLYFIIGISALPAGIALYPVVSLIFKKNISLN